MNALQAPTCDRHIAEPVHRPAFWQTWLHDSHAVRSVAAAALLGQAGRLVVAAPHPDDELLMCAGLMQAALAQGLPLAIVSVTDGEACFGRNAHCDRTGAIRRAEAQAGLHVLGAEGASVHRLSIPDGGVAAQEWELQCALQGLLRPGDLVVAPWRLDGHPDHDATGRAAAAACALSGGRLLEAPVWMWHWATPARPEVRWNLLRICTLPAQAGARKQQALACHASQLRPQRGRTAVVDSALQARARWPFESFFLP